MLNRSVRKTLLNASTPVRACLHGSSMLSTTPQDRANPKAGLPLSPAVIRLVHSLDILDVAKIKGTGLRGRLTKGDILTHLKQASSPSGTAEKMIQADAAARLAERSQLGLSSASKAAEPEPLPLDGLATRQFITEGLSHLTLPPSSTTLKELSFDSILKDYDSSLSEGQLKRPEYALPLIPSSRDKYLDGLDQL